MFNFFHTIFVKITSVIATAIIAVGIVSMPQPSSIEHSVAKEPVVAPQEQTGTTTDNLKTQLEMEKIKRQQAEKELEKIKKQQELEYAQQQELQKQKATEQKNSALQEIVNHMNDLTRRMNNLSQNMKEYQAGGINALKNGQMQDMQQYGVLYQAAESQYNQLYNEYKQYDLMRLQIMGQ